jgi:hypothetical protein
LPDPGPALADAETTANDPIRRAIRTLRPHTAFLRVFGLLDKRLMMTSLRAIDGPTGVTSALLSYKVILLPVIVLNLGRAYCRISDHKNMTVTTRCSVTVQKETKLTGF